MKGKLFVNVLIPVLIVLGLSFVLINNAPQSNVALNTEGQLELHFIDVGQGDSMLAKMPNSKTVLIDAGTNSKAYTVTDYLKKQGVKKIDILIATHPHEDHIGGMDEVISKFDIGEVYMPKLSANTKAFEKVLTAIKDKNLKVNSAKGGMVLLDENGLKLEFIAPNSDKYDEINNYSAVTKITYGNTSFLLTGDAEYISETEMQNGNYNLKADVLKIAHHGSKTSSALSFLQAVSPQMGIISVGKDNSYNHPDEKVLQILEKQGIDIYRTDQLGTIILTSDGKNIKVGN